MTRTRATRIAAFVEPRLAPVMEQTLDWLRSRADPVHSWVPERSEGFPGLAVGYVFWIDPRSN